MSSPSADNIAMLTEMGFPAERARQALNIVGVGNVEAALNFLLTNGSVHASPTSLQQLPAMSTATPFCQINVGLDIVQCALSQYEVSSSGSGQPAGRSACSCIALNGAFKFLSAIEKMSNDDGVSQRDKVKSLVSADFLQSCILEGVELYQKCMQSRSGGAEQMEHFSPEEVLKIDQSGIGQKLTLAGGMVRQGLLVGSGANAENGLHSKLVTCFEDNPRRSVEWTPVIMTKTPETVLVLLPPTTTSNTHSCEGEPYVLIDSHPRPAQFNTSGSYALILETMEKLEQALTEIFPATALDPDIGDIAAMMYNSFDLYPLQMIQRTK